MHFPGRPTCLYLAALLCILQYHTEHCQLLSKLLPAADDERVCQVGQGRGGCIQRHPS